MTGYATLLDSGFIGQTGIVTVGLNSGDKSLLTIAAGAAYNFRAQSLLTGNGAVKFVQL